MTYHPRPKRKGYVLTDEAEQWYQNWLDGDGCTCFIRAPCSSCTDIGHPISLENDDEAWEPEFTEYLVPREDFGHVECAKGCNVASVRCVEDCPYFEKLEELAGNVTKIYCKFIEEGNDEMSREDVVNVKQNKSEWFGYKYRVNPETSKLLQEAVFRDGGGSVKNYLFDKPYLFVSEVGKVTWLGGEDQDYFNEHPLPEKDPPQGGAPQPKGTPDHIVDAVNTCVGIDRGSIYTRGEGWGLPIQDKKFTVQLQGAAVKERPSIEDREFYFGVWKGEEANLFKQTEEKQTMSNANRRVVNVKLLDNDSGLPVELSLVAQFSNIVTEDSNEVVVQEILLNKNIADTIAKHNQERVKQTDLEVLKRTGNDVKLRPVKLKDLTWVVTTA